MTSLTAFIFFAVAATVSPGPNNLLLMYSGLNYGIKKTWPLFIGAYLGCLTIYAAVSFGLGYFFLHYPRLQVVIKVLGSIYMLYLALKIAQLNESKTKVQRPLSLFQGFSLQMINPKLWIAAITMNSMFEMVDNLVLNALYLIVILSMITIPRMLIWMGLGRVLVKLLKNPRQRKVFNITLGLFLAVAVLFLWID